jgi:ABC-2 type transport system permease protein
MRHEWRNLSADRTPLAVALVLGVAIAYGAYNGSQWVRFQQQATREALAEEQERYSRIRAEIPRIESGEKTVSAFADPRLPQSFGRNTGTRYAAMPPAALGALAVGQTDLHPYYFRVSTNSKETFLHQDEIENPVHLLSGRFDVAFVLLYLYPLVILAFSYNILSAEKENGTLALALSQPVSLGRVVLAKVLPRLLFVLALAVVLPVAGLILGGANLGAEGVLPRLLAWTCVTAAYGVFWFAMAVAVNAMGRGSATNALTLAGVWLLLAMAIPSVLNVVVQWAYPAPSRVEMIQAVRAAGEEATRQGSQLLARYLEDHPELMPAAGDRGQAPDFGTLLVAVNEATEQKVRPVLAAFESQLAKQQQMVDRLRYVSPAIVAQAAYHDAAGVGAHRYRHFLEQVEEYHRQWRGLPSFAFREETAAAAIGRCGASLAGLLIPSLIAALVGAYAMRRYPVAG